MEDLKSLKKKRKQRIGDLIEQKQRNPKQNSKPCRKGYEVLVGEFRKRERE